MTYLCVKKDKQSMEGKSPTKKNYMKGNGNFCC